MRHALMSKQRAAQYSCILHHLKCLARPAAARWHRLPVHVQHSIAMQQMLHAFNSNDATACHVCTDSPDEELTPDEYTKAHKYGSEYVKQSMQEYESKLKEKLERQLDKIKEDYFSRIKNMQLKNFVFACTVFTLYSCGTGFSKGVKKDLSTG